MGPVARSAILYTVLALWVLYVASAIIAAVVAGESIIEAVPPWVWSILPGCYVALRDRSGKGGGDE